MSNTSNNPNPGPRRLATISECAQFLGVVERSVRNYISRGLFPAYRIPGTRGVRVDLNEVNKRMRLVPATVARTGTASFGPKADIRDLPWQAEVVPASTGAES